MAKPLYGPTPNSWDSDALERTIRGITAVLLSLKKKPVIRYEKMSGMAKKLAVEIQVRTVICIVENCNTEVRLIAPNTVRVDSIWFPLDSSFSTSSHTRPTEWPRDPSAFTMDLPGYGSWTARNPEWPCGSQSGTRHWPRPICESLFFAHGCTNSWYCIAGNNPDTLYRPLLRGPLPSDLWRPGDVSQILRPIIPIPFPGPRAIINKLNQWHETIRWGVSWVQEARWECQ